MDRLTRRAVLAATALLPVAARAQGRPQGRPLRIAVQTETSSLDPHFAVVGANEAVALHVFDSLVASDTAMRPVDGLTAVSNPRPDIWEFRVRDGAVFQDGTPVTAEALRFSIERMPRVPNSPAPFVRMQAAIAAMDVVDARTLRIRSHGPDPSVPLNGMTSFIVPPREATTAEFNTGPAAVGSGPWRLVSWQPGDVLRLRRNETYWGLKPDWAMVEMRAIAGDASRLAALLSGDVDLIDRVAQSDLPRLRANTGFAVTTSPSSRVIYIALDQAGDATPFVTGKDGKPLPRNPLRDVRVRRALSGSINRAAIVERVLQGGGQATGQLAVPGQVDTTPAWGLPRSTRRRRNACLARPATPTGSASPCTRRTTGTSRTRRRSRPSGSSGPGSGWRRRSR